MVDKNGVEMHIGDVVKVTGGYYASNNGLWIINEEPGVGSWCGDNYHMLMATKRLTISRRKYNGMFWPIVVFNNSHFERKIAETHNAEHATIDIVGKVDVAMIEQYEKERWA